MSLKNLFKKSSGKVLPGSSMEEAGTDAEVSTYIAATIETQERITPWIDFSSPSNFAFFGSAEKYYEDSINRIQTQYPYDGSLTEKQQFYNSSSFLDNYILDFEYPRTTGYATLCVNGWGSAGAGTSTYGLREPVSNEYIKFFGTMNVVASDYYGQSNIYSSGSSRTSNLKLDGRTGNTVEFWLKKGATTGVEASTCEVIFDLWNGATVSNVPGNTYGRLSLILDHTPGAGVPCDLLVQYASGGVDVCTFPTAPNPIGQIITDDTWNHYAVTFQNNGTALNVAYYVNGALSSSSNFAVGAINEVTGSLIGYLGATQTAVDTVEVAGVPAQDGWGKFSGSIDEFRYWRSARTAKDISRNWFTQINNYGGGGANTEDTNVSLGAYYKFNEGITEVASTDAVVLDYSGRVSNGAWTGYSSNSRSTGSAMIESGVAVVENTDPIIYSFHPEVASYMSLKQESGSIHDDQNVSQLQHKIPNWVIDEDSPDGEDGHLTNLIQMLGSYFDSLYLQIKSLPSLTEARYVSGSMRPLSVSHRLLSSCGMIVPEIFANATVLEQFLNQDESRAFETKLSDTKNLIYQNIYNNLNFIYKSKGTEKSFRNLLRCYGVDDELVKLNVYANNLEYELKNNSRTTALKKNVIDFNNVDRFNGTVYQYSVASNSNTVSYVSASGPTQRYEASGSALTFEGEFIFPKKLSPDQEDYFETPFTASSLFGCHTAQTGSATDTSWASPDASNFQVYAVKDKVDSRNVVFRLTGSSGGHFPLLTSSLFYNVYDNEKWNLAVKITPQKYGLGNYVSGAHSSSYDVAFVGYNTVAGQIQQQFNVTGAIAAWQGNEFLTGSKRVYAGAHYTNFTSSIRERTDVRLSSVRCWYDSLPDEVLLAHAKDSTNAGALNPYESTFLNVSPLRGVFVPRAETLLLNWDFSNVTGSDVNGRFIVDDISSGSVANRTRYGWLGNILKNQHTGRGSGFLASDSQVVDSEYIMNAKQTSPDQINSSDMIQILTNDDVLFTKESRPISFVAAYEKSMYQTINEEMVNLFATVVDFNNLIGAPVNRYRQQYKEMEKLKSLFFEKVGNTPDLEKYVEYYKWIDQSLSVFLKQLIPASAEMEEDIQTVIESHILERPKYWNKLPTIEHKLTTPEGTAHSIGELKYNWKTGHYPIGGGQNENCVYWNTRHDRATTPISSSDAGVNAARTAILALITQIENRKQTAIADFVGGQSKNLHGGENFNKNTTVDFYKDTFKFGNIAASQFTILSSSRYEVSFCEDDSTLPRKQLIQHAVSGYDVNAVMPFTIVSSSVRTGHNAAVVSGFRAGVEIIPHGDCYGPEGDIPMQGPFTETWVGGRQNRHWNNMSSSVVNLGGSVLVRPEAYRLYAGGNALVVGGPDSLASGLFSPEAPRAPYYREELAKRPISVKNMKGINYSSDNQIVMTSGRWFNNKAFVMSGGFAFSSSASPTIYGISDYAKPDYGQSKHVIVERFSAPGDPSTMGDASGGPGLDSIAGEYSVYNSMNFRNSIVRGALNTLSTRPCGQFGTDSELGAVNSANYESSASYHKTNRNPLERIEIYNSLVAASSSTTYDNWFLSHPIPQDDSAYTWMIAGSKISGSADS